jgi:hypothetical protein
MRRSAAAERLPSAPALHNLLEPLSITPLDTPACERNSAPFVLIMSAAKRRKIRQSMKRMLPIIGKVT